MKIHKSYKYLFTQKYFLEGPCSVKAWPTVHCQTSLASLGTAQHRHHLDTAHSTLRPHHHQQEEKEDNTAVRYILPLPIYHQLRRKMNQCNAEDEQATMETRKYICLLLLQLANDRKQNVKKCSRKKRFSLGHFGQILTKPHKKCSEKC